MSTAASPLAPPAPVVIIGAGLAGLTVALHLAEHRPVIVLAKRNTNEGATQWAQGGRLDKVEMYTLPGGQVFFEAHITRNGQDLEVLVGVDGQTIAADDDVAD